MTTSDERLRGWLVAIVIIHFLVALWHGTAHVFLPVPLSPAQTAFVAIVVTILPLVGAGLLWTDWRRAAAWLIALSMLGSLLFGLVNHFMRESSDYVGTLPAHAWRHAFILSAALVAVTETIGAILGAVAAQAWRSA